MPTISERALRDAYDPRRRPDYFDVAVNITRARVMRDVIVHWTQTGAPIQGGRQLTACGAWAPTTHISDNPTCAGCRQQQALHDAADL
jgi:hypothetical protein